MKKVSLQTELNGLKWRCFLTPSNSPRGVPIQSDPILKAYGQCLRVRSVAFDVHVLRHEV